MIYPKYVVFDIENNTSHLEGRKAGHFLYDSVVALGFKSEVETSGIYLNDTSDIGEILNEKIKDHDIIVGHNLKHDLLFVWNLLTGKFKNGLKVWDTMLVEYLLSGQEHKYPALREISLKYGCKERPKYIEELLFNKRDTLNKLVSDLDLESDSGKKHSLREQIKKIESYSQVSDLPYAAVVTDVTNDVEDTEKIFKQQYLIAKEKGILLLIEELMDGLLAFCEIEYNGMFVNPDIFHANYKQLLEAEIKTTKELLQLITPYWDERIEFNFGSTYHISALFFGKEFYQDVTKELVDADGNIVKFKTGRIKTQKIKEKITVLGLGLQGTIKTKRENVFKVDDGILSTFAKLNGDVGKIANLILLRRNLKKQISTYYEGLEKFLDDNSIVHPNFKLCETETGRSSCQAPNTQNQPKPSESNVKKHFTSRFKKGKFVKADYKQLETIVFAEVTKDPILKRELIEGIDIHKRNASEMFGYAYDEVPADIRQATKAATFGIIYGSGPNKLALTINQSVNWCKDFIRQFFNKYKTAAEWQQTTVKLVEQSASATNELSKKGYKLKKAKIRTLSGRILTFWQQDTPDFLAHKGIKVGFNPPDIKNYPIQSLATADLSVIMMGKFWREKAIRNRDKYLMINFVHDEIDLDCKDEWLDQLKKDLKLLEEWPLVCYNKWYLRWSIPIHIDVGIGESWGDCK